ncbi:hypothetical protein TNCV_2141471 [Trichonephila clavipes]|uniref:Uncharacterized protein n=1 Tax=Trichonephila clavipes TaxID=2585209 RepID=A0A8X6VC57_TRICX|nr:hypothetical protein TNCV_2141471 [Trichonephila clavipes]
MSGIVKRELRLLLATAERVVISRRKTRSLNRLDADVAESCKLWERGKGTERLLRTPSARETVFLVWKERFIVNRNYE